MTIFFATEAWQWRLRFCAVSSLYLWV